MKTDFESPLPGTSWDIKFGFVLDELTQDLLCCLNCDELEVSKSDLIFSLDHRVESCFMDWILELYL